MNDIKEKIHNVEILGDFEYTHYSKHDGMIHVRSRRLTKHNRHIINEIY